MLARTGKLAFTVGLLWLAQLGWAAPTVLMGEHVAPTGGYLRVPVQMTNVSGLAALTITVNYDAGLLALTDVSVGALSAGFALKYNSEPGRVVVALIRGAALAAGSGTLAHLYFTVNPGARSDMAPSPLAIADLAAWGQQGELTTASANGLVRIVSVGGNSPPVPGTFSLGTSRNAARTFSASQLTRAAQDADGDPVFLTAVSATSTNSGTVQWLAGQVTYAPPSDYTGADAFSYTLSDQLGGTATGIVCVVIEAGTAIPVNCVFGPIIDSGNLLVRFAGMPGATYTIEYTDTVAPVNWLKATNLTAPATAGSYGRGVFQFSQSAAGVGLRFYRTVYPAY